MNVSYNLHLLNLLPFLSLLCSVLAAGIDKYIFILLSSIILPLVLCSYFLLFLSSLVMSLMLMFVIDSSYKKHTQKQDP